MTGKRPIFGIFEGGGAKGLAHIGALQAVEANNLEFVGVAGASAGAIVAALVAAGLRSGEIFDPSSKSLNVLSANRTTTTRVLGEQEWTRFLKFRHDAARFGRTVYLGGIGLGAITSYGAAMVALGMYRNRGHFSTSGLRDLINGVLRERLVDLYAAQGRPKTDVPERILFRHLDYERFPELRPLKIVATDLGQRALTVFDLSLTPDVEIAEAVAASVAIPLVFEPVVITSYKDGRAGPFVDGGLISNSPSWVFTEEKLAFERRNPTQPPVPIVSFTLVDKASAEVKPPATSTPSSTAAFLADLVRTAIFGSQAVSQRFIEDVLIVPLETSLGVLDFDADWDRVRDACIDGRRSATRHLRNALTIKPDLVRTELKRAHDLIKAGIDASRGRRAKAPLTASRASLIERFGVYSLRVTAAYNMQDDPDDRLLLDSRGPGAPEAFRTRSSVLVEPATGLAQAHLGPATKYERALVRQSLHSAICVPIFKELKMWMREPAGRDTPLGVFCFDSDEDLKDDFSDPAVQQLLAERSVVLSSIFERSDS